MLLCQTSNLPETFDDTNAVIVHKNRKMCNVDESLDGFTTAERKKSDKNDVIMTEHHYSSRGD